MNINDNEFFNIKNKRYKMIFSIENAFGIFRKKLKNEKEEVSCYDLIYYHEHNCSILEDILKDIMYLHRSGEISLCTDDIVSIKINGTIVHYCFYKTKKFNPEKCQDNFFEVSGFLDTEKEKYMQKLEHENKLLSILDAKIYTLDEIDIKKQSVCCIEEEVNRYLNMATRIVPDYSVYILKDMSIKQLHPYPRPFKMLKNVFYYINKEATDSLILVANRSVLEKLRDYYQLKQIAI